MIAGVSTKREQELARRHLETLTNMRDEAWKDVIRSKNSIAQPLENHAALDFAVKLATKLVEAAQR